MKTIFAVLVSIFAVNAAHAVSSYNDQADSNYKLNCLVSSTTAPTGVEDSAKNYFTAESYYQVISINYDPSEVLNDPAHTKNYYFGAKIHGVYTSDKENAKHEYMSQLVILDDAEKDKAILRLSLANVGSTFGLYINTVGAAQGNRGDTQLDIRHRATAAVSTAYRPSPKSDVTITTLSCFADYKLKSQD